MAEEYRILTINQHETLPADTEFNKINVLTENSDLSGVNEVHKKMNLGSMGIYKKPSTGIPKTDLANDIKESLTKADTAYQKPAGGIPRSAMGEDVMSSLGKADTAYQKASSGIPKTDLASAVQTSLGKADNAQPKETGKGLSTNDYTTAEKTKVASSVLFTSQTLSDAEKTQARNNIGVEQATITQADIDNIWR